LISQAYEYEDARRDDLQLRIQHLFIEGHDARRHDLQLRIYSSATSAIRAMLLDSPWMQPTLELPQIQWLALF